MTPTIENFSKRIVYLTLLSLIALVSTAVAQQIPQSQDQSKDVLRINTELVQTGVAVFDKQGKFVEGLKPEQFDIKVDGTPVQASLFERVVAGTAKEEKQVAGAVGSNTPKQAVPAGAPCRGRTIL